MRPLGQAACIFSKGGFKNGSFQQDDQPEETEPDSLPFHPLDLSEATLLAMLGFQFERFYDDWLCEPEEIPIMRFSIRKKPWWKIW